MHTVGQLLAHDGLSERNDGVTDHQLDSWAEVIVEVFDATLEVDFATGGENILTLLILEKAHTGVRLV